LLAVSNGVLAEMFSTMAWPGR